MALTPKGRSTVKAAFDYHAAVLEQTMKVLSDAERNQLHGLLKKLGLFAAAIKLSNQRKGYEGSNANRNR